MQVGHYRVWPGQAVSVSDSLTVPVQVQLPGNQASQWCKFLSECRRPMFRFENSQAERANIPFCSIQVSSGLDEAHPHRGRQSALLSRLKC